MIYKPGAYNSLGIYKGAGGIYKGRGVYNDDAGGGGGGDIPPEYRDDYKQVGYIQSQTSGAVFLNISYNSDDIIKMQYGVVSIINSAVTLVQSTNSGTLAGSTVNKLICNNNYSGGYIQLRAYFADKNVANSSITSKAPNTLIDLELKYPYLIFDGSILATSAEATQRTSANFGFFNRGGANSGHAIGITEILDKVTNERKYKFVPCKNKNTGAYGWLEIVTGVFGGNASGTDTFTEWTPAE